MTETRKQPPDHKEQVYGTNSAYIDPMNCDSTVSYKVCGHKTYLEASVELADCGRKISWSFSNERADVDKIDTAISMLSEFRKLLVKAQKDYKKEE